MAGISLSAAQSDGLSTSTTRLPNVAASQSSTYQPSICQSLRLQEKSTLLAYFFTDYHHGVADLYVNDLTESHPHRQRHLPLQWMKNRFHWTQEYRMSIDLNNIYAKYQERSDEIGKNSLNITGKFTPYWQYKTETFRMSFSPDFIWERFTYPQKTLLTISTYLYLYKNWISVRELTIYGIQYRNRQVPPA